MDEEDKRHEVSQIERVPGLYITDWVGAASVNEANILEITHILSVLTATELEKYGPDESSDVELRHYEIADEPEADLLKDIDRECDWIDTTLNRRTKDGRKGTIIVHCQQGISRSAAVTVAYLMKKYQLRYEEAVKEVKSSRSVVNMNAGFQKQLRQWQLQIGPSTPERPARRDTTTSVKTPIREIGPLGIIDWRDDPDKD